MGKCDRNVPLRAMQSQGAGLIPIKGLGFIRSNVTKCSTVLVTANALCLIKYVRPVSNH